MRRLLFCLGLLAVAGAGTAHAATHTYSTGTIRQAIPDGGSVERRIRVRDAGPVSYLTVAVRIDHPDDGQLTLQLRAPSGRQITLSEERGAGGAGYGTGPGCDGQLAYFEDGSYNTPVAKGSAPFVDGPNRPEQPLRRLFGREAAGTWVLRVTDSATGGTGAIRCVELEISRDVVEHATARAGRVAADLSYRETDYSYSHLHLRIERGGRAELNTSLARVNCAQCPSAGPNLLMEPKSALTIRDLDSDGEPEVLLDLYTGGAHCCFYTLVFRQRPKVGDYDRSVAFWGDPGYRIADLDHDGRSELVTADDRFAYTFSSYADSALPLRILHYDHGTLLDVTGEFRGLLESEAAGFWKSYLGDRGGGRDIRGVLAAYMADEYRLGRQGQGWARLEVALTRGELHPYGRHDVWPTDRAYLTKLRVFLVENGYAT